MSIKYGRIFLFVISLCIFFSPVFFAQSEEEMDTLRLFYDDKDLIVSATRHLKPISQVAENITILTSGDIAAMNAHTVGEVLNRIPGLFISGNRDFGAYSLINIQGAAPRNTLVLVDDIPQNSITEGSCETTPIPVGIIDRIEIIMGPASSAWGSSLGGVINIITKPAGNTQKPNGSIQATYGRSNSQDYRAELSGKTEKTGYYFYASALDSKGLVKTRFSDNKNLYSKIQFNLSENVDTGFSIGYSDNAIGFGDLPDSDIKVNSYIQSFSISPYFYTQAASGLLFKFSAHYLKQKLLHETTSLGLGAGQARDLYLRGNLKEESLGVKGQVVWKRDSHTVVFGMDFEEDEYNEATNTGTFLQTFGVPAILKSSPDNTKFAIYTNDTITWEKFTVIPGLRYDNDNITGSFVSPSLGITYALKKNTILRGTIAKGFSSPSLSWTSGGGLFLEANPSLKHEKIWSYQAGIESSFSRLWIKASVFFHDEDKFILREPLGGGPPAFDDLIINDGKVTRKGFEIEFETAPVNNFSLKGALSYVDIDPPILSGSSKDYACVIGINYNGDILNGQLTGYYNWHDNNLTPLSQDDLLWDFTINKEIHVNEQSAITLIASAHNLFNGSQYSIPEHINPKRWLEFGIKIKF